MQKPFASTGVRWLAIVLGLVVAFSASAAPRYTAKKRAPSEQKAAAKPAEQNDFPTLARVEYVLQCMQEHGGQNYDNLYHCVCAADTLARALSYQEYSEALVFTYLYDTPGERGGEFRDPPKSKVLREKLKAAKSEAERCFPKPPEVAEKPLKK